MFQAALRGILKQECVRSSDKIDNDQSAPHLITML